MRLRARTFVITDDSKTVAFVNCDGGMASDMVKMRVLEKLNAQLGEGVITAVIRQSSNIWFDSCLY